MQLRNLILSTSILLFVAFIMLDYSPCADAKSIKIGGLLDFTGPTSDVGKDYASGMNEAIRYINAKGGINGKKIKFTWFDYGYRIPDAIAKYKLLKRLDVDVIMGWGLHDSEALLPYVNKDRIPYVSTSLSPAMTDPTWAPYNLSFAADYSTEVRAAITAWFDYKWHKHSDYLKRKPRLACIYYFGNSFYSKSAKIIKDHASILGFEIGPDVDLHLLALDAAPQVAKLKEINPDVVWHGNPTISVAPTLRDAYALGLETDWIINRWAFEENLFRLAGESADGVMGVTPCAFYGQNYKYMDLVVESAKKYNPKISQDKRLIKTVNAWCNALMTLEALKRADRSGNLTGPGILKRGFETMRNFDIGLGASPVTFTSYDHRPTSVILVQEWKKGRYKEVGKVDLKQRFGKMWDHRFEKALAKPPPWKPAELVWNSWAEDNEEKRFTPSLTLKHDTEYRIVLDLSAFHYKTEGVQLIKAGSKLIRDVETLVAKKDKIDLKAVLLPDLAYFRNPAREDAVKPIKIDLKKIRNYMNKQDIKRIADIMAYLRDNYDEPNFDPDFVFGNVNFDVKTKSKNGWASLAIILFKGERPIDELVASFCIGQCQGEKPSIYSYKRGFDSFKVSIEESPSPNASLYFIELKKGIMTGLLNIKHHDDIVDYNEYFPWDTDYTMDGFTSYFVNTLIPEIGDTNDTKRLKEIGDGIVELLFPHKNSNAVKALNVFKSFLQKSLLNQSTMIGRPIISVRIITFGNIPPILLPIGLMVIETTQGKKDFIGKHFKIETPLQIQSYKIHDRLPSRWITVIPPKETEASLKNARKAMGETLKRWKNEPNVVSFDSIHDFQKWIRYPEQHQEEPIALIVLSHQAHNKLYFSKNDFLLSTAVKREFKQPSLCILNACGTAEPTAIDFIKRLNIAGIETIIATASSVDANLAGKYFQCIDKMLIENSSNPKYNISDMHHNCLVECLWKQKNPVSRNEYGPNALKYILLGNGNIRLCDPCR